MSQEIQTNIKFLKTIPFFARLEDEELSYFLKNSEIKEYKKNKLLFLHGDKAKNFYIIISGWVKLFRETMDGDESILALSTRGDSFGEDSIFENENYQQSCQIIDDTKIIIIPAKIIRDKFKEDPSLALSVMAEMHRHINQMNMHIEHLSVMTAPQRVGCFLLSLCKEHTEGSIVLKLPYDKSLIATRLGVKAETLSRSLASLKEQGVNVKGSEIHIENLQKLADFCCVKCSGYEACSFSGKMVCNSEKCAAHCHVKKN